MLVFDEVPLAWLELFFGSFPHAQCLCPGRLPALRCRPSYALSRLGVDRVGLILGSLRPGGAASLFEAGMDLGEMQHRGSWHYLLALGHYVEC